MVGISLSHEPREWGALMGLQVGRHCWLQMASRSGWALRMVAGRPPIWPFQERLEGDLPSSFLGRVVGTVSRIVALDASRSQSACCSIWGALPNPCRLTGRRQGCLSHGVAEKVVLATLIITPDIFKMRSAIHNSVVPASYVWPVTQARLGISTLWGVQALHDVGIAGPLCQDVQ